MELKDIVGNAATLFTIGVFLAGIEICRKIWLKKSTAEISAMPFLCGLISCSLWLRYGLLIKDDALMIVNLVGCGLQISYIIWYIKFTLHKVVVFKKLFTTLCIIASVVIYTEYFTSEEQAQYLSGISACSAGVIFMASPLVTVVHVIETKTADSMPFFMILCTFIMATLWFFYGIIVKDKFVQIPNFLGALLALAQLCLFFIYPNNKIYYAVNIA